MSSALPRKLQRDRKHHGRRQLSVATFSRNISVDWRAAVVSVVRIWILRVASRTETGGPWSEHSYVPSREKVVVSSSAPCLTLFVKLTLFCPWAGLVVSDWWQCDRLCGVSVCQTVWCVSVSPGWQWWLHWAPQSDGVWRARRVSGD